jgi:hypothetical protein
MQTLTIPKAESSHAGLAPGCKASRARSFYLQILAWAFTIANSVRVVSYIPMVLAIHASGDSSQHSILTWGTWLAANLTMSAWQFESNDHRVDRIVAVAFLNASMCLVTLAVIVWYRMV